MPRTTRSPLFNRLLVIRLLVAVTMSSALTAGCAIVNRDHLDSLENGDSGMPDGEVTMDAGTDGGNVLGLPLVDRCGDGDATYTVFDDSTDGMVVVSTMGQSNRVSSCGARAAPGNDGFVAIDVVAGDQWHFHVIPDPSVEQDRDPFLYLLPEACDSRACDASSDSCQGPGDEHFAFVAPSDGRFYLGIDDRIAGGGQYLIQAVKLFCGDGMQVHGEACDGSATCDSRCREVLTETRSNESLPNDNEIEANQLEIPASGMLRIRGSIGGDACVYPDVYRFDVPNDNSNLTVRIVKNDGTPCDVATLTPFNIILRNTAGEVRAGPETDGTCATLDVTGLDAASYFLYLEHDEPIEDRVVAYVMDVELSL